MEKKNIEYYLEYYYKYILIIIIILLLLLYTIKGIIIENILIQDNNKLISQNEKYKSELVILNSIKSKFINSSYLTGKYLNINDESIVSNKYKKIIIIKGNSNNKDIEINIKRLITSIKTINKNIIYKYYNYSDIIIKSYNDSVYELNKISLLNNYYILILAENNEILTSYTFSGEENYNEWIIIKEYLLNILITY
jgi:hypothetical protein